MKHCMAQWSVTFLYRMTDLSSMIKYDFKLVTYTKSNGARSGLNGWWIVRWNPNTSISSYVPNGNGFERYPGAILRVQHEQPSLGVSSTTHAWDRGEPSGTQQHTISLIWRISLIQDSNIKLKSSSVHVRHTQVLCKDVLCCILIIPTISTTYRTMRRQSQTMPSSANFTILQL